METKNTNQNEFKPALDWFSDMSNFNIGYLNHYCRKYLKCSFVAVSNLNKKKLYDSVKDEVCKTCHGIGKLFFPFRDCTNCNEVQEIKLSEKPKLEEEMSFIFDMPKPLLIERFACNGEHSHWELINPATGEKIWEPKDEATLSVDVVDSLFKNFMVEDNNRTAYEFYKFLKQSDFSQPSPTITEMAEALKEAKETIQWIYENTDKSQQTTHCDYFNIPHNTLERIDSALSKQF